MFLMCSITSSESGSKAERERSESEREGEREREREREKERMKRGGGSSQIHNGIGRSNGRERERAGHVLTEAVLEEHVQRRLNLGDQPVRYGSGGEVYEVKMRD